MANTLLLQVLPFVHPGYLGGVMTGVIDSCPSDQPTALPADAWAYVLHRRQQAGAKRMRLNNSSDGPHRRRAACRFAIARPYSRQPPGGLGSSRTSHSALDNSLMQAKRPDGRGSMSLGRRQSPYRVVPADRRYQYCDVGRSVAGGHRPPPTTAGS